MDIHATPAYGRDYKSKAAVLKDWNAGKDFLITGIHPDAGRYFSIRDLPSIKGQVWLRYNGKQDIVKVS